MTQKDYTSLKRNLGFIEGIVTNTNSVIYDGVMGAIQEIDEIIDKEMVGEGK